MSSPKRLRSTMARYALLTSAALISILALAASSPAAPPASTDLKISMTGSPSQLTAGGQLTYSLSVQNLGTEAATGTTVTDTLPKGVDYVSSTTSSGTCAQKGQRVTCDLGTLAVGSNPVTITIIATARTAGTIKNTATVSSDLKDPVAANNSATVTTKVQAAPTKPTCLGATATLTGTAGADHLNGTGGRDVIVAFGGNDTITGLAGKDLVCAGNGNDYIASGSAADHVVGGGGRDRLIGQGGPDLLQGGAGGDVIKGGAGNDRLRGGTGFDRCRGGAGADSVRGCEA